MDHREQVLREAISKNTEETERWETYQNENTQAIENLERFSKKLFVDVMVPIGQKAFIPGRLIHTNEVFVAHYQGYFSNCSVNTASQICRHRLQLAQEQLKRLKTESELWQNKLAKPYLDGAVPNLDQQEIIEEYDEEKEKIWRQEHKLRLRESKLREREQQKNEKIICSTSEGVEVDDITKILADAELIEELQSEIDSVQMEGVVEDDLLKRLIADDVQTMGKKRISHQETNVNSSKLNKTEMDVIDLSNVCKKSDLQIELPELKNNNCRINPDLSLIYNDENESDSSTASETPAEVQLIEKEAKFLTREDQIGFYQYQIQIIKQKIRNMQLRNIQDIEEKLHLFEVRDRLKEILECIEEEESECRGKEDPNTKTDSDDNTDVETDVSNSRRITFALENQTLEFHKNEKVEDMLRKPQLDFSNIAKKDIIHLDESLTDICETNSSANHLQKVLEKVESNFNHFSETQSLNDYNLVEKMISKKNTLHIYFKHSEEKNTELTGNSSVLVEDNDWVPKSPADIPKMFPSRWQPKVDLDSVPNHEKDDDDDDDIRVPILKESNRSEAYIDLRAAFSNPKSEKDSSQHQENKSILRKKSAAEGETCAIEELSEKNKQKKKNKKPGKKRQENDEGQYMSAYDQVVGDVVEKSIISPEPLPNCKYIDANAPKKRVSRFKQMRSERNQTHQINLNLIPAESK